MLNIAVLVSGGGTNLQALLESERRGENPNGRIVLVVASKPGVYALERAASFGVESAVVSRKDYADSAAFDAALLDTLQSHNIDVVVLAGFLSVLGEKVIAAYRNKIINVHPSLIPSFCGPGFYGLKVHEAALGCFYRNFISLNCFAAENPNVLCAKKQKNISKTVILLFYLKFCFKHLTFS